MLLLEKRRQNYFWLWNSEVMCAKLIQMFPQYGQVSTTKYIMTNMHMHVNSGEEIMYMAAATLILRSGLQLQFSSEQDQCLPE